MGLSSASIEKYLQSIFLEDLHVRTILSMANATVGVLYGASLCIHVIGRAYAWARGGDGKHGVKQIDRLLSNGKVDVWSLSQSWIAMLVGVREEILVALDWTEFDKNDHSTLVASLVTRHGRATPLLWRTVRKSRLAGNRGRHEFELLEHLKESLPEGVRVTIVADRGFGDQSLYQHLKELGFDYIIRYRAGIVLADQWGTQKPSSEWLAKSGRAKMLKDMAVTHDCYVVPAVVLAHDKRMKEPWALATSRTDLGAPQVVKWYGRRFSIEENFRDTKDIHFGLGLSATHVRDEARRDRLIFIAAIAQVLVTLLGAAGERCGLDRTLKSNTSKKRQMSLFNQGLYWFMAIPNMREERLRRLVDAYTDVLREHELTREIFSII